MIFFGSFREIAYKTKVVWEKYGVQELFYAGRK